MSQAYIAECEYQEPGEQVWFPSLFEAEQVIDADGCCKLIPVPANYSGPKWVEE